MDRHLVLVLLSLPSEKFLRFCVRLTRWSASVRKIPSALMRMLPVESLRAAIFSDTRIEGLMLALAARLKAFLGSK